MARSKAKTVAAYLKELPAERREVIAAVRKTILSNLPAGYEERMNWGMISYEVPLSRYPKTYNGQPLSYVALAAQKNYYAVYLMSVYEDSKEETSLRAAFEKAGKKLDMGKCCVRFRRLEDVPLAAIGKIVAGTSLEEHLARYEASRPGRK